jgi:hypothetical protein
MARSRRYANLDDTQKEIVLEKVEVISLPLLPQHSDRAENAFNPRYRNGKRPAVWSFAPPALDLKEILVG